MKRIEICINLDEDDKVSDVLVNRTGNPWFDKECEECNSIFYCKDHTPRREDEEDEEMKMSDDNRKILRDAELKAWDVWRAACASINVTCEAWEKAWRARKAYEEAKATEEAARKDKQDEDQTEDECPEEKCPRCIDVGRDECDRLGNLERESALLAEEEYSGGCPFCQANHDTAMKEFVDSLAEETEWAIKRKAARDEAKKMGIRNPVSGLSKEKYEEKDPLILACREAFRTRVIAGKHYEDLEKVEDQAWEIYEDANKKWKEAERRIHARDALGG